jgi:hypothetical protein
MSTLSANICTLITSSLPLDVVFPSWLYSKTLYNPHQGSVQAHFTAMRLQSLKASNNHEFGSQSTAWLPPGEIPESKDWWKESELEIFRPYKISPSQLDPRSGLPQTGVLYFNLGPQFSSLNHRDTKICAVTTSGGLGTSRMPGRIATHRCHSWWQYSPTVWSSQKAPSAPLHAHHLLRSCSMALGLSLYPLFCPAPGPVIPLPAFLILCS